MGKQPLLRLREWKKLSSSKRIIRFVFYVPALATILWSLETIEIDPEILRGAQQQAADLFIRMWPIDWAWYPKVVHPALVETIHTASIGTILAISIAMPISLLAARNVTRWTAVRLLAHFTLIATRSVHSMIWALFFAAVVGPGALAGTLAIAVHSIGFTGKFLSEAIEEVRAGPIEALKAVGAPVPSILTIGYWPQVKPAIVAIATFRWEINIRESAVIGMVGGGGLGAAMEAALSTLHWDRVALILIVIFAVVATTEVVSAQIRSRLI